MNGPKRTCIRLGLLLLAGWTGGGRVDAEHSIRLDLRTRNPKTNALALTPTSLNPRRIGIVIVDPWEYHWCMTWTAQAGGMSARINRALEGARKLGMSVFWAPTDTASMFSGWLQRQRAMAVPYLAAPSVRKAECRWTVRQGACLCVNYGFDGMDPHLAIGADDFIVSGAQELYSLCRAWGITHLIYFGGATNICLTGKDIGLGPMYAAGLETIFARDLAFAWTQYDPANGYTPTTGNAQAADDLERAGIPTVVFVDALRRHGLWDKAWITEPVRITPDIPLAALSPTPDLYGKLGPAHAACLWQPKADASYEGKPLRIRGTKYAHGLGMRAPAYARYELKPACRRFVALAGVDDNMLDYELGRNIAKYPSMVFKIFLDGRLAAESPVLRISQAPWRFDVPIPPGTRRLVLVCDDAGNHSPYNLGNWVEAGFPTARR